MEKFRGYRADSITSGQLQKFFLSVMGVRPDEIVDGFGQSTVSDYIFIPYSSRKKGRSLRAQFWDSTRCERRSSLPEKHFRAVSFEIPRKSRRVTGVSPGSIISIRKISGSGNKLSVISRGVGTGNPSFDVWVYQRVGRENSHWLGMLKKVGAKVLIDEEAYWPFPNVL